MRKLTLASTQSNQNIFKVADAIHTNASRLSPDEPTGRANARPMTKLRDIRDVLSSRVSQVLMRVTAVPPEDPLHSALACRAEYIFAACIDPVTQRSQASAALTCWSKSSLRWWHTTATFWYGTLSLLPRALRSL